MSLVGEVLQGNGTNGDAAESTTNPEAEQSGIKCAEPRPRAWSAKSSWALEKTTMQPSKAACRASNRSNAHSKSQSGGRASRKVSPINTKKVLDSKKGAHSQGPYVAYQKSTFLMEIQSPKSYRAATAATWYRTKGRRFTAKGGSRKQVAPAACN